MLICRVSLLTKRLHSKERGYNPSTTLPYVRKWGPSTRNVLRSIEYKRSNLNDVIELEARGDAFQLCKDPSGILVAFHGHFQPAVEGSGVAFLRRKVDSKYLVISECSHFIPTPTLIDIFEAQQSMQKTNALNLFSALSWHSLTRTAAGWSHELQMHRYLSRHRPPLVITRMSSPPSEMLPTPHLLQGTLSALLEVKPNDSFYWIPSVAILPGVDSVLGQSDGKLFVIQATIASDHRSPKEGMDRVWGALQKDTRKRREWHVVNVTDSAQTAELFVNTFSDDLISFKRGVSVQVWGCVRAGW